MTTTVVTTKCDTILFLLFHQIFYIKLSWTY